MYLFGLHERQKRALFTLGELRLFGDRTDAREALSESDVNTLSTTPQSGGSTVKGRVTCAKNNDVAVQRWDARLGLAHPWLARLRRLGKESL